MALPQGLEDLPIPLLGEEVVLAIKRSREGVNLVVDRVLHRPFVGLESRTQLRDRRLFRAGRELSLQLGLKASLGLGHQLTPGISPRPVLGGRN